MEQPGPAWPEVAWPGAAWPEVARRTVGRPEVARPEVARPEVARPEVARRTVARPEVVPGRPALVCRLMAGLSVGPLPRQAGSALARPEAAVPRLMAGPRRLAALLRLAGLGAVPRPAGLALGPAGWV